MQFILLTALLASSLPLLSARTSGGTNSVPGSNAPSDTSPATTLGTDSTASTAGTPSLPTYVSPIVLLSKPLWWRDSRSLNYVYGLTEYKNTTYYEENPNNEPTVCSSFKSDNGLSYVMMICPLHTTDMSNSYCCGDVGVQYCCGYWDSLDRMAWTITGIVVGALLLFYVVISATCALFCRSRKRKDEKPRVVEVRGLCRPITANSLSAMTAAVNMIQQFHSHLGGSESKETGFSNPKPGSASAPAGNGQLKANDGAPAEAARADLPPNHFPLQTVVSATSPK